MCLLPRPPALLGLMLGGLCCCLALLLVRRANPAGVEHRGKGLLLNPKMGLSSPHALPESLACMYGSLGRHATALLCLDVPSECMHVCTRVCCVTCKVCDGGWGHGGCLKSTLVLVLTLPVTHCM